MTTRTWVERLWQWRDRFLADPANQNLTVASPLLRPVANRRAKALFDLCIGFVHTQVITACVNLDVFDRLADGPLTPAELAARTGLSVDAAERLLRAASALKLLALTSDGRYRLAELGAAFRGAPGLKDIVHHNQIFYRDLTDPVALLRAERPQTELSRFWPYAEGQADVSELSSSATAPYTRFMAATQPFIADDVLAAHPFQKHRALLDVGGGNGTFAARIGIATPSLEVAVFDLPSVASSAEATFEAAGLKARSRVHCGDFHRDELPQGYDVISLVRVLLDHDDATVLRLLKSVRRALPEGGTALIAELMADEAGAETFSDAYFGFYLLAMGRGRPRSVESINKLLQQAGFQTARQVPTRRMLMTQLIIAR